MSGGEVSVCDGGATYTIIPALPRPDKLSSRPSPPGRGGGGGYDSHVDENNEDTKHSGLTVPPLKIPKRHLSVSSSKPPHRMGPCLVCGDDATGMYFGALVCVPCKTFFLRYAGDKTFICRQQKVCEINTRTRTQCKFCRMRKCLQVGMARKERPAQVQLSEGQQLCVVCQDVANGLHFGAITCEGCKKFFRRGLKEHPTYVCKNPDTQCIINPRTRNTCRYCRYQKCLAAGMSREAIQMGRPSKIRPSSSSSSTDQRGGAGPAKQPRKDSTSSSAASMTGRDDDNRSASSHTSRVGFRKGLRSRKCKTVVADIVAVQNCVSKKMPLRFSRRKADDIGDKI